MAKKAVIRDGKPEWVDLHTSLVEVGLLLEDAGETASQRFDMPYKRTAINGIGVDGWLGDKFLIEYKNWAGWQFAPTMYRSQILNRFLDTDPDHKRVWILVISILECSLNVIQMMARDGIQVIELGFQVEDVRHSKRQAERIIIKGLKKAICVFTSDRSSFPVFTVLEPSVDPIIVHAFYNAGSRNDLFIYTYCFNRIDDDFYRFVSARVADSTQKHLLLHKLNPERAVVVDGDEIAEEMMESKTR